MRRAAVPGNDGPHAALARVALPAGCAVRPAPLTEEDTALRVAEDRRTPAADRPQLDGPLTLLGAMP